MIVHRLIGRLVDDNKVNGHDPTTPSDVAHGSEKLEGRYIVTDGALGDLADTRECRHALKTKRKLPDTGETKSHRSGVLRGSESKLCAPGAPLGVHGSRRELSLDSDPGRLDDAS